MELKYADIFSPHIIDLYAKELTSVDLYNSNQDIQIINGKQLKLPKLKVGGYKDHNRYSMAFNTGSYSNDYEIKTLDHDRDIEFAIDPLDVDETNLVVSIANIQKRFETTQAIPEKDCYTYSKIYAEAKRVGATISNVAITTKNILTDFDEKLCTLEEAGVPLDRVILYCTPVYKKLLKEADGIQRTLNVTQNNENIDRRVHTIDDIKKIVTVPSARFKTSYNFTDGCVVAEGAKQINYMLIDPEAQVSRNKYSYINVFTPGHDSRTADKYLYQNRNFNGSFALDELLKIACIINAEAEE